VFGFAFGALDDVGVSVTLIGHPAGIVGGEAEFASTLAFDGVRLLFAVLSGSDDFHIFGVVW
jgi:hypothetical protein